MWFEDDLAPKKKNICVNVLLGEGYINNPHFQPGKFPCLFICLCCRYALVCNMMLL